MKDQLTVTLCLLSLMLGAVVLLQVSKENKTLNGTSKSSVCSLGHSMGLTADQYRLRYSRSGRATTGIRATHDSGVLKKILVYKVNDLTHGRSRHAHWSGRGACK